MLCAIWYHLYNLKSVKNTNGGVLQALACKFTKSDTSSCLFFHVFLIVQMVPNRAKCLIYITLIYGNTKDVFGYKAKIYSGPCQTCMTEFGRKYLTNKRSYLFLQKKPLHQRCLTGS